MSCSESLIETIVSGVGVTTVEVIPTGTTVIIDVSATPPAVAVIPALPPATPVTRPVALTVAFDASSVAQTTAKSGFGWFCESVTAAVSCSVAPWFTEPGFGVIATAFTGLGSTPMPLVSAFPSDVAITRPDCRATSPFTRPVVSTEMLALVVDHAMARPLSTLPAESFSTATICTVPSRGMSVVSGVRVTEATGGTIEIVVESQIPSHVLATMYVVPSFVLSVTEPAGVTVPIVGSRETHASRILPVNAPPPATVPVARMGNTAFTRASVSRGCSVSVCSAESGAAYQRFR